MKRRNLWGKWEWIIWEEKTELADVEMILEEALFEMIERKRN